MQTVGAAGQPVELVRKLIEDRRYAERDHQAGGSYHASADQAVRNAVRLVQSGVHMAQNIVRYCTTL